MKYLLVFATLSLLSFNVSAKMGLLKKFKAAYPQSKSAETACILCHTNEDDYELNSYAQDYQNNKLNFKAIEAFDSDVDGFTNIEEISAGTQPGDKESMPAPKPLPAPEPQPVPPAPVEAPL